MTPRKKAEAAAETAPKKTRAKKQPAPEVAEAPEAAPVTEPEQESSAGMSGETPVAPELPDVERMVVFHLAGQRYGIPIDSVQEIQQIVAFSEVPAGSSAIIGMINLRGYVIPAFDMRVLLGAPTQDFHVDTPMIICKTENQLVALVVDEVEDVVELPEGCLSAPPRMHALRGRMVGVCRMGMDLVYLLDVEKLMAGV